jgi:hypothetical protein
MSSGPARRPPPSGGDARPVRADAVGSAHPATREHVPPCPNRRRRARPVVARTDRSGVFARVSGTVERFEPVLGVRIRRSFDNGGLGVPRFDRPPTLPPPAD